MRWEHISIFNQVTGFDEGSGSVLDATRPSITSTEALPTLPVLYRLTPSWTMFANAGRSFGPQQYSQLASTTEGLHPEVGASVYANYTYTQAIGRAGAFAGMDLPLYSGFATVSMRAGYDFGKQFHDLRLAFGVKNLFDRRYFTRSTDNNGGKFVGLRRTVYVQASLAF